MADVPRRIREIQEEVADYYGQELEELLGPDRHRELVRARHVAMFLARQEGYSFPVLARGFGGRDHTTVMHAVAKVERLRGRDQDLAHDLTELATRVAGRRAA